MVYDGAFDTHFAHALGAASVKIAAISASSADDACCSTVSSTLPAGARRYTKSADLPGHRLPISCASPSASAPANVERYSSRVASSVDAVGENALHQVRLQAFLHHPELPSHRRRPFRAPPGRPHRDVVVVERSRCRATRCSLDNAQSRFRSRRGVRARHRSRGCCAPAPCAFRSARSDRRRRHSPRPTGHCSATIRISSRFSLT